MSCKGCNFASCFVWKSNLSEKANQYRAFARGAGGISSAAQDAQHHWAANSAWICMQHRETLHGRASSWRRALDGLLYLQGINLQHTRPVHRLRNNSKSRDGARLATVLCYSPNRKRLFFALQALRPSASFHRQKNHTTSTEQTVPKLHRAFLRARFLWRLQPLLESWKVKGSFHLSLFTLLFYLRHRPFTIL